VNPLYTGRSLAVPDELAEMIREPARAAGLTWEERAGVSLDKELLRDATGNPEALPLLEYTLAELYERRQGRLLRWSDYEGGLKGALISAANEVVEGSGGDADTAFRDVMRDWSVSALTVRPPVATPPSRVFRRAPPEPCSTG
jgi:hypothetical protein